MIEQSAAGTVFKFDDPEIAVAGLLPGQEGVDLGLGAFGQGYPDPGVGGHVKAALEGFRLPVQRGYFHDHRPGGLVTFLGDVDRDFGEAQPGQVGGNPDAGGEARLDRGPPWGCRGESRGGFGGSLSEDGRGVNRGVLGASTCGRFGKSFEINGLGFFVNF